VIVVNNLDILRTPCSEVLETEVPELIQTLEMELAYSARMGRVGIGLAAIQCAIPKKAAIVRLGGDLNLNLINAEISKGYDEQMFRDEGCLSFPGVVENTMRFQEVYVINNLVPPHNFIATGLLAVVIAHELDHLNGIVLPDRALPKNFALKLKPNDLCFCGQKKKYKQCHGKNN
jgi:peptide deformylase